MSMQRDFWLEFGRRKKDPIQKFSNRSSDLSASEESIDVVLVGSSALDAAALSLAIASAIVCFGSAVELNFRPKLVFGNVPLKLQKSPPEQQQT